MKSKKIYRTIVHDLRDIDLTKIAVPNVSGEFAGLEASHGARDARIVTPGIGPSIPAAMQLRYLQTLTEIGAEQNSTIIFPMPIDIIKPFLDLVEKTGKPSGANGAAHVASPDGAHANA